MFWAIKSMHLFKVKYSKESERAKKKPEDWLF